MRKLIIILFCFISLVTKAQVYQEMPQYGYRANRMSFDSTLQIPTTCGVPTLKSVVNVSKKAAIAFDSCNNKFYQYNPKTLSWSEIAGGGTTPNLQQVTSVDSVTSNTISVIGNDLIGNKTEINIGKIITNQIIDPSKNPDYPFTMDYRGIEINDSLNNRNFKVENDDNDINLTMTGSIKSKNGNIYAEGVNGQIVAGNSMTTPLFYTSQSYINPNSYIYSYLTSQEITFRKYNITSGTYNQVRLRPIYNSLSDNNNALFYLPKNDINNLTDTLATLRDIKNNTIDTANKWVNSITKLNDSTLQVIKGTTTTDLTITGVSYAKKLKTQVWNNTGDTINKGSVVYISGRHSSNLPTIALAEANSEANSYKTFAIVENDILDNSEGTVIQAGNIGGLNLPTSNYTDGDIVYLSPTVPGGLTITKPLAPYHICKLGSVTRAHPTQGSIEVKIENGWQLDELSDVQIPAVPNDSTLLQFSRVDSLWHSVSVTNAIGTNYLKPTDTTSLSSRINTKLNTSDSSIYYTKYRSDTSRNNIYSAINSKGYAINLGAILSNTGANTTYYFGMPTSGLTNASAARRVYIPTSGTIKSAYLYARCTTGSTGESWSMSIRLNNSSNTTISSVASTSSDKLWSNTGLNIAVVAGDYIEITTTTPAWVSGVGNTLYYATIFIQ